MSQTAITLAFEQHLADVQMGGQPVIPDEFVLANIPGLDSNAPIDRAAGLPTLGQIVHRQLVDQRGKVNANGVAYSIIMDTRIGDFTFNAMYLVHKASGLVAMVVHKAPENKLKNQGADQPGNSLVKSMLMEYQGAAEATNTTVDASTWQIDFSSRLLGLDRDIQQHAVDHYGDAAFMGDGLLVSAGSGVDEFIVAAGHGYIAGLRAELEQPHSIVVVSRPATVYADVYHAGTLFSDWDTHIQIRASATPLADYVDEAGYPHYVTPLAQLAANGAVTDLRGRGGLWWHEHRPQAHTKDQVGLDKLENWSWSHSYTDATGGAGKYATGKGLADAYNALNSNKLDKTGKAADSAKLNGQLASFYLSWGNFTDVPATFPPDSHSHLWKQITGVPETANRWPDWSEVTGKPASVNNTVPVGAILMWSGSIDSIPAGYRLCDGTGGTPNLLDRFIVGAGKSYAVGTTGGAATTSHNHTGAVAGHALTVAQMPSHNHAGNYGTGNMPYSYVVAAGNGSTPRVYNINNGGIVARNGVVPAQGGGAAHSHGLSINESSIDNRPPYYALAYIMKI